MSTEHNTSLSAPADPISTDRSLGDTVSPDGAADPLPAELPAVPGYEVLSEAARGGMGVVYRAQHLSLNRVVALKMILAADIASPEQLLRFRLEAELAARVQHPGIVAVYEIGAWKGLPFLAMEWLSGGTLAQKLSGGPLAPREAAGLLDALARAVQAAHSQGVIHRDLKPANVLLDEDGAPKVTDFGLARSSAGESGLTRTGAILGTPEYMAPEQALGHKQVGVACDIYALGVILYECLTGRPPFRGANMLDTLQQVANDEPPAPRSLSVRLPRDLQIICLKCLRKDPDQRYRSVAALADDLGRFLRGEPIHARRVGEAERAWKWARRNPALASSLLATALALVLGAGVAGWFAIRADENARRADENARLADERSREAETTARRATERAYLSDMRLVQRFWDDNLFGPLPDLLERQRPERTGGLDLRGFEWFYWDRQERSAATLKGHADHVNSVAFSPDGRRIVSGSADKTVRVWDTETGQQVRSLKGHADAINCVAFGADGKRIVSGGWDRTVRVWDAETGPERLCLRGHADWVYSVAFSADQKRIVSGSKDKTAKVWDAETGHEKLSFMGHADSVYSVAFSADQKRIVSGSNDNTAKVWDAETGQEILSLKGHEGGVTCVAFSADGKHIVSGSRDRTVRVWDAERGREILTLKGHAAFVKSVAFSANGKRIVSGGEDRTVKVWDAETGQEKFSLKGHADAVNSVAFSADGKRIVSGSSDKTVKVWSAERDPSVPVLAGHLSQVTAVALNPSGVTVASAGGVWKGNGYTAGELKLWDAGGRARDLLTQETGVTCVAYSPDGALLASGSGAWDAKAKRYASGEVRLFAADGQAVATLTGHGSTVLSVAFSPDGKLLASAALDGSVNVWDVARRQKAFDLPGQQQAVTAVAFSPDGPLLAAAGFDEIVTLHDLRKRERARALVPNFIVSGLAFSPDGSHLALAGYAPDVPVYEVATGNRVLTLTGHTGNPTGVAFSPDGRRIATCGEDHTVRLWDAASGQEVLTLKGHTEVVRGVAFSKDGRRLVSGGWDRTVRVWDASPLGD